MKNNLAELLVFILGTAISITLGIAFSHQFDSPYHYVIALLSEIIVIIISIGWHLRSRMDLLSAEISDHSITARANEKVRQVDDPSFTQQFIEVRQSLVDIANGYYSIQDLAAVYADDILSIDDLRGEDVLRSMCPVGGSPNVAVQQFLNKSFQASMEAHYRAASRGVKVHRIYIFETRELLRNSDACRAHITEANGKGIKVRIIVLDEKPFEDALRMPHDFIIFAEKKVSVGRVGPNSRVDGADVYADKENIERYRLEYEKLMRLSEDGQTFV